MTADVWICKAMSNMNPSPPHPVLLATDLSDNSPVALGYAAEMASTFGAELLLLHVLDPTAAENPMESSPADSRDLVQAAKLELQHVSESLLAARGIAGKILVRSGNVRDVIFQVQQEYSADLVVLGSSGKRISRKGKLGSVAEAVLRSLLCNVLTVGPHVDQHLISAKARSVLFPTDFSVSSIAALSVAISLATNCSADLLLLHICDPYEDPSCLEQETKRKENLADLARSAEKQTARIKYFLREGRIAERTVSFAKEQNAAYIVMGVQHGDLADGTRLHGIVADVVREAYCPILTVAERAIRN
jgi:nucleotide-binding universal stress UspA family protein